MSGNFKKEDLRVLKTEKALTAAMSRLLEHQKFTQITINGLCEEALISRATFYAHFFDKYDFLRYWLANIKSEILKDTDGYKALENNINNFADRNKKVLKNLLEDANSETAALLCDFMLSLLDIHIDKTDSAQINPSYIVLSEFCSGGLVNYLKWQIESKFPEELQMMNVHLYDLLSALRKWYGERK